jgi:putative ABC transport system substrate-binding protein
MPRPPRPHDETFRNSFLFSRRVQLATFAARYGLPSAHAAREEVEAGGLTAGLPVLQSSKFEFVINLQTARLLRIEVLDSIQLLADEVIE